MKYIAILFLFIFIGQAALPQFAIDDSTLAVQEIESFREQLNREFKDTAQSPLTKPEVLAFTAHDFYPVDLRYRVVADLILTPEAPEFEMPTTTKRRPVYKQYAFAVFILDSITYKLSLFQNTELIKNEEYADYLFLPFKDHTNGFETYGGGRYIDLRIPKDDKIIIDFNQSYNPYCAYSYRYSCPVPPDENSLPVRIESGIKFKDDDN